MRSVQLIREPAKAYHARRGEYLTSHLLADFRKSAALYKRKVDGKVPDEDRPAYVFGRAAHTFILEGQVAFEDGYVRGGPVNPKTGERFGTGTKAFGEWLAGQGGKEFISEDEMGVMVDMRQAVESHERAAELIAEGQAEGVARSELLGTKMQARLDWWNPSEGIVDLKTCDDLTWFESDARRYGYMHQMAFYQTVIRAAFGVEPAVHIIAVEKKEPYRCGVWAITGDVLRFAHAENVEAMGRLKWCKDNGVWPTGYEDVRAFDYI